MSEWIRARRLEANRKQGNDMSDICFDLKKEIAVDHLEYCEIAGRLRWKVRSPESPFCHNESALKMWNKRYAGEFADSNIGSGGYRRTRLGGKTYYSHRIVWLIKFGTLPIQVDHINGDRRDNRISNLRNVTPDENNKNLSLRKANKSGVVGVSWNKKSQKWRAQIKVNGETIHIGFFEDINLAAKARRDAEAKYKFHPNHGRR